MTVLEQLTHTLLELCQQEFPEITQVKIEIKRPTQTGVADFTTTIALTLFNQLPVAQKTLFPNPRNLADFIAKKLSEKIQTDVTLQAIKLEVAGPGFINVILPSEYYLGLLNQKTQSEALIAKTIQPQDYVVEYSSPNIAKPFTVGHLRSTIIGHAVANLLETTGHTVFRDNHVGDWGTQFGKQIYAIKTWGDESVLDASQNPAKELVALYVKFHQEAEIDPSLDDAARAWFKKLEDGDVEARRLWQKCIDWSWKEFNRIYEKLGVTFSENEGRGYGESFFETHMAAVITELREKKLLTQSEGAELVFYPNDQYPPLMITKKDGSTLYATRDLATDKFRLQHYGNEVTIINEVGAEQQLYFQQLYALEALLGWVKPKQRIHIKHGLIRFKDGKMSTRKGNVIWLDEVLNEAFVRTKAVAGERLDEVALWQIAIGAIKWNDLKRNCEQPISFDWDEVLRLEGNSGPYLQYAYTRCMSVLKDNETQMSELKTWPAQATEADLDLLKKLLQYEEAVARATVSLAPHLLCTYLFELAQDFSSWYAHHSVLKAESDELKQLRLALITLISRVLKDGLDILGISVLQKM
jgi:arginyl-tRNA synthetase